MQRPPIRADLLDELDRVVTERAEGSAVAALDRRHLEPAHARTDLGRRDRDGRGAGLRAALAVAHERHVHLDPAVHDEVDRGVVVRLVVLLGVVRPVRAEPHDPDLAGDRRSLVQRERDAGELADGDPDELAPRGLLPRLCDPDVDRGLTVEASFVHVILDLEEAAARARVHREPPAQPAQGHHALGLGGVLLDGPFGLRPSLVEQQVGDGVLIVELVVRVAVDEHAGAHRGGGGRDAPGRPSGAGGRGRRGGAGGRARPRARRGAAEGLSPHHGQGESRVRGAHVAI
jgi:hypothetical protein